MWQAGAGNAGVQPAAACALSHRPLSPHPGCLDLRGRGRAAADQAHGGHRLPAKRRVPAGLAGPAHRRQRSLRRQQPPDGCEGQVPRLPLALRGQHCGPPRDPHPALSHPRISLELRRLTMSRRDLGVPKIKASAYERLASEFRTCAPQRAGQPQKSQGQGVAELGIGHWSGVQTLLRICSCCGRTSKL